ncbi:MAG TPA: hypothetical protein VH475_03100 [Tepidisphaeraceae bacterium]|jgi:tetratricopeptide (TPR) repeat protein
MKSEHRHELKTNDLAKSLITFQDYAKEYGGRVALGLAIVILAIVLITQRISRARSDAQRYQDNLAFARSVIDRLNHVQVGFSGQVSVQPGDADPARRILQEIREKASDKHTLADALLAQGDLEWALANYPDLAAATQPAPKLEKDRGDLLKDAKAAYQRVLEQYPDQPIPVAGAHFGLAAVAENERQWDDARKHYDAIKNAAGASQYKNWAEFKLKRLDEIRQPVLVGQVAEKFEIPAPPSTGPTTQLSTRPAAHPSTAGARPTTTRPAGK